MVPAGSTDERTDADADRSIGIALYQGLFYGGGHIQNAVMLALALAGGLTAGEYITTTLRRVSRSRRTP